MSELSKRVLSALMVMGAQSQERAMNVDDLAAKLGVKPDEARKEVLGLVVAGYATQEESNGTPRVYLTGTGIITASSTYS